MRSVLVVTFGLLLTACLSHAGPIYLLGWPGDDLASSYANSINASGLVVGGCFEYVDSIPCYWDLNEAPLLFTGPWTSFTANVLEPHLVLPLACAFAGSDIADITDSGQIFSFLWNPEVDCPQSFTGQIPGFTTWWAGTILVEDPTWTPLGSPWTHTPRLWNSRWSVTTGSSPFTDYAYGEGYGELAHFDAVPEPSSFLLVGICLCALLMYRVRGPKNLVFRQHGSVS